VTVTANDPVLQDTLGEVTRWFFDDYLNRWISVANGTRQEGPEFILDYWGCPLYVSSPTTNCWLTEPEEITERLARMQADLREAGYTHTTVPDSRVTVFHPGGVAIEAIWSRRADDTELELRVIHYEVARSQDGWRVVAIQAADTSAQSPDEVWPIHRGQHGGHPSPRVPAPRAQTIRPTEGLPSWTQRQKSTGLSGRLGKSFEGWSGCQGDGGFSLS
jgi:hypothetical protein